jgi:hypothetical protein
MQVAFVDLVPELGPWVKPDGVCDGNDLKYPGWFRWMIWSCVDNCTSDCQARLWFSDDNANIPVRHILLPLGH